MGLGTHDGCDRVCRWLWLTMAVPDPPTNGQFLYSKGLIEAADLAGIALDVVAFDRPEAHPKDFACPGPGRWWVASGAERSRWASALSTLPHLANRTNTKDMRRLLSECLQSGSSPEWEAIVFDSLAAGWALRQVLNCIRHSPRRPLLVYAAHNHEATLGRRVAAIHPHPIKRQINRWDALKVARLERALARHADIITADAPEDCHLFQAEHPETPVEWLPPVFLGRPVVARWIGPRVPRRAVMLGSFDWLPKRANLVGFLRAADPLFAAAGVELHVVGAADRAFLDELRKGVRATTFVGPVADATPHLAQARFGIAAEQVGGGFKLKTLDYVFNRVPMAALTGTIPGMPLVDGESAVIRPDPLSVARRIIELIDDFETLNRLQVNAYRTCSGVFEPWTVGEILRSLAGAPALPTEAPELANVRDLQTQGYS